MDVANSTLMHQKAITAAVELVVIHTKQIKLKLSVLYNSLQRDSSGQRLTVDVEFGKGLHFALLV